MERCGWVLETNIASGSIPEPSTTSTRRLLSIPEIFEEYAKEHAFRRHWYRDWVKGFDGEEVLKPKERRVLSINA